MPRTGPSLTAEAPVLRPVVCAARAHGPLAVKLIAGARFRRRTASTPRCRRHQAPLAGIHPRTRTSSRTAWLSPDGQALGNGTAGRPTAVQFAET